MAPPKAVTTAVRPGKSGDPAEVIPTVERADLGIRTLAGVTRERTPLRLATPEPDRAAGPR